jgi:hypothetical protein
LCIICQSVIVINYILLNVHLSKYLEISLVNIHDFLGAGSGVWGVEWCAWGWGVWGGVCGWGVLGWVWGVGVGYISFVW